MTINKLIRVISDKIIKPKYEYYLLENSAYFDIKKGNKIICSIECKIFDINTAYEKIQHICDYAFKEKDYYNIIRNGRFDNENILPYAIYISDISTERTYRRRGYANDLMKYFLKTMLSKQIKLFFLVAYPYEDNFLEKKHTISQNDLVNFYKSLNFVPLITLTTTNILIYDARN